MEKDQIHWNLTKSISKSFGLKHSKENPNILLRKLKKILSKRVRLKKVVGFFKKLHYYKSKVISV